MQIDIPEGHTRICGKEQGYLGLPIRDQLELTKLQDGTVFQSHAMVTRWSPTEDERVRILAGEDVYVVTLGKVPAPMRVGAGDPNKYGW